MGAVAEDRKVECGRQPVLTPDFFSRCLVNSAVVVNQMSFNSTSGVDQCCLFDLFGSGFTCLVRQTNCYS